MLTQLPASSNSPFEYTLDFKSILTAAINIAVPISSTIGSSVLFNSITIGMVNWLSKWLMHIFARIKLVIYLSWKIHNVYSLCVLWNYLFRLEMHFNIFLNVKKYSNRNYSSKCGECGHIKYFDRRTSNDDKRKTDTFFCLYLVFFCGPWLIALTLLLHFLYLD